ncbi:MAG: hypothetical protein ACFFD3_07195 [Candidatus Thorarchaeota archaeon]
MNEESYDEKRPNLLLVVAILLLIGSPGSLLLFTYTSISPFLLILIIPFTVIIIYGLVRIIRRTQSYELDSKEY